MDVSFTEVQGIMSDSMISLYEVRGYVNRGRTPSRNTRPWTFIFFQVYCFATLALQEMGKATTMMTDLYAPQPLLLGELDVQRPG